MEPKEDESTNPFCYGKSLAEWIKSRFSELGYQPEPIIAEDWGWCVVLTRDPFMLWVGCGNDRSEFYDKVTPEDKASFIPHGHEIEWSCIVGTDTPVWTAFFWKSLFGCVSIDAQVSVVTSDLRRILENEARIQVTADEAV